MSKSNIVFFTWPNRVFLHRDLDKWIELFATKYGEYNISRLDRESAMKANIAAELTTPVFLGEKRLIVLSGIPSASVSAEEKTPDEQDAESQILRVLAQVPETTIVVFVESEPDKRRALYKELLGVATVKEYPVLEWGELRDYVRRKLPHIDISAASLLIEYMGGDADRLESEIEKLALYKTTDWITESDIREHVSANIETSVFTLTDALLELDAKKAHREFMRLLETDNIHYVATTIVSTLRTFLYLMRLSDLRYTPDEIKSALKVHPFVFDKMKKRTQNRPRISELFSELVTLDRRVKTGEGVGDTDDALRLGIEKAILCLQKA